MKEPNPLEVVIEVLKELRSEMHDKSETTVISKLDEAIGLLEQHQCDGVFKREVACKVLDLLGVVFSHLPQIQALILRFFD